jgi:hypothetical protein
MLAICREECVADGGAYVNESRSSRKEIVTALEKLLGLPDVACYGEANTLPIRVGKFLRKYRWSYRHVARARSGHKHLITDPATILVFEF